MAPPAQISIRDRRTITIRIPLLDRAVLRDSSTSYLASLLVVLLLHAAIMHPCDGQDSYCIVRYSNCLDPISTTTQLVLVRCHLLLVISCCLFYSNDSKKASWLPVSTFISSFYPIEWCPGDFHTHRRGSSNSSIHRLLLLIMVPRTTTITITTIPGFHPGNLSALCLPQTTYSWDEEEIIGEIPGTKN